MNNILITGGNGQLGSEIKELSAEYQGNFFFTDRNSLDISNKNEIQNFVETNDINIIINCAAYTAVDKAETDVETAARTNTLSVKYLATIAKEKNISLVHISTDYVFDGQHYKPYTEEDRCHPNGVYGKTKRDGEVAMQEINPCNSIIIRTSWIYSSFGENFVKTMLRLGKDRESLGVIYDQVGTPTYAKDLAQVILDILPKIDNETVEIYHYSNEGASSWYDFAKEIMHLSNLVCQINAIETKEYPTPAKRPHFALLNKSKIKKEFGLTIPYWKDSLATCMKKMGA